MSKSATPLVIAARRSIVESLASVPVDRLSEAEKKLRAAQTHCENLSGVFAVLRGLTLLEVKSRLKHGEWQPWLAEHFPQSDREARRLMQVGEAFLEEISARRTAAARAIKNGHAAVRFDLVVLSDQGVNRANQIDFSHPFVAAVAAFVDGRGSFQLMQDIGALSKGGPRDSEPEILSDAEKYKRAVAQIREDHKNTFDILGSLTSRKAFQALPDKELHAAIDTAEQFLQSARAWVATPKAQRAASFKID